MTRPRALMLAIAMLGTTSSAFAQAALAPHLAAYRLGLHDQTGTSALIEARGGLVIEWRLECDGWVSRQRLGFVASIEGGGTMNHDVRFTSWESTDGTRLRYVVRSFEDDELKEEYRGLAELEAGGGGIADFSAPHKEAVKLPPGTVFPTEHMQLVLDAAAAGQRFISHEVFDGFGFDALTQVTSVIGEARPVQRTHAGSAGRTEVDPAGQTGVGAGKGQAWPVSMAYHNVELGEETPQFEASFLLDDRGILHDVLLDYGDFRLDASLEQLELLDRPDC
jgi:EipB-like